MSTTASRTEESESLKTLIVGVGNPLLGDEGIGPYAARHLSQLPMPPDVEILDCGCDILSLFSHIDKPKKIIVLDAVLAGGKPGQVYRFDFGELENIQIKTRSAHQLQMVDAMRLLKKVYPHLNRCEIIVIGVEPKLMELSRDLSEEVRGSIANLTRLVLEEL